MRRFTGVLAIPLAIVVGACGDTTTQPLASDLSLATESRGGPPSFDRPRAAPAPGDETIAQIVVGSEDFETLESVLTPDLVAALSGTEQFTVFAPTDAAFGELEAFLQANFGIGIADLSTDQIVTVLLYHVTEGRRAANSVVPPRNEREIETLLGNAFFVQTDGTIEDALSPTGLRADAAITDADVSASNGIVHVIDQVLIPPQIVAALTGN